MDIVWQLQVGDVMEKVERVGSITSRMVQRIPSMHGFTTGRLLFRAVSMDDRHWWMEYINSADAIRFMSLTVGSEDSCREFIQRALDRQRTDGSGLNAIIEQASGKPVGMIGLLTQEVDGVDELEVGYHLLIRLGQWLCDGSRHRLQGIRAGAPACSLCHLADRPWRISRANPWPSGMA